MGYDQLIQDFFWYFFVGPEFLARHNYIFRCLLVCVRNPTPLFSYRRCLFSEVVVSGKRMITVLNY